MLALSVPPLASPNPACSLGAKAFKDPHINFAFGGSADLRGRHNALYNFLSAPGLSVNVKTEEAVFKLHDGALTVNGSFLTEAHISAQLSPQKTATASFFSSELDPNNFGWRAVNGSCVGRPFRFGNRGHKSCFGFEAAMDHSSATFELRNWTINVHGMRSCKDRGQDCLVSGPEHRLDIGFYARGDAPYRDSPHGIIGQSYATRGRVRNPPPPPAGSRARTHWTGLSPSAVGTARQEGSLPSRAFCSALSSRAHCACFSASRRSCSS